MSKFTRKHHLKERTGGEHKIGGGGEKKKKRGGFDKYEGPEWSSGEGRPRNQSKRGNSQGRTKRGESLSTNNRIESVRTSAEGVSQSFVRKERRTFMP